MSNNYGLNINGVSGNNTITGFDMNGSHIELNDPINDDPQIAIVVEKIKNGLGKPNSSSQVNIVSPSPQDPVTQTDVETVKKVVKGLLGDKQYISENVDNEINNMDQSSLESMVKDMRKYWRDNKITEAITSLSTNLPEKIKGLFSNENINNITRDRLNTMKNEVDNQVKNNTLNPENIGEAAVTPTSTEAVTPTSTEAVTPTSTEADKAAENQKQEKEAVLPTAVLPTAVLPTAVPPTAEGSADKAAENQKQEKEAVTPTSTEAVTPTAVADKAAENQKQAVADKAAENQKQAVPVTEVSEDEAEAAPKIKDQAAAEQQKQAVDDVPVPAVPTSTAALTPAAVTKEPAKSYTEILKEKRANLNSKRDETNTLSKPIQIEIDTLRTNKNLKETIGGKRGKTQKQGGMRSIKNPKKHTIKKHVKKTSTLKRKHGGYNSKSFVSAKPEPLRRRKTIKKMKKQPKKKTRSSLFW